MKKMTFFMIAALMVAVLVSGCGMGGAKTVGVLDVNKVMADSPKIKQMQEQLNVKGKELSDQLEKDKASITPEEFQKRQETAYGEFVKLKQELEGQVDATIKTTLEQISKEKNLGAVLYKAGVAQGGIDITDDVIKKMQ